MTVSYQYEVASSTSGGFTRLLFKWKGSLYKLVYRELFVFCIVYGVMSCVYRYFFNTTQKRSFEKVVMYCDTYMNYIPLSFILGFYVSFVASRWWQQYMAIPWPDKIIHAIALHVVGYDEKGRMMRRALVRYLNLSLVLILRSISSAVKKRFPTLEHLVEAGFITSTELGIYNLVPNTEFNTYWIPCTWFTALLKDAKAQKRITDPLGIKHIMEEFNEFRQKCGLLWSYDWVSIPLVYTQVVTIATYSFFLAAIVGRQYVEESPISYRSNQLDLYIPLFTILQVFFYMGLLKVAEQLINPFGDDDEDFELNWIIDRHMKVSYLIVDTLLLRTPPLSKDIFYDDECPVLPYTAASAEFKKRTYRGSVANMVIPEEKQNLILPDIQEELEEGGEFRSTSNLASQMASMKSSVNNLGGLGGVTGKVIKVEGGGTNSGSSTSPSSKGRKGRPPLRRTLSSPGYLSGSKDQRSLSVPDDCLTLDPRSSSPRDGKKESSKSAPISRSSSRRIGTAGSKGIGSALLAIGSHQGFLAADPEKISLAGGLVPSASMSEGDVKERQDDDLDYLVLPVSNVGRGLEGTDAVALDMSTVVDDDDLKIGKPKKTFRLPASLKARLAVKKKPVITWRPYERQMSMDQMPQITPEEIKYRLAGEIQGRMPEDLPENLPPGEFEDECAFMWRTIDDDSDSLKTALSTQSEDHRYDAATPDTGVLSHYRDIKPNQTEKKQDCPLMARIPPRPAPRRALRRARYKTRGRMRCCSCSLPLLSCPPRGSVIILPNLVKSISENSVFLEVATRRLSSHTRSQDKSQYTTKSQSQHSQHSISLPSSKLTVNGRQSCSSLGHQESQ
ncbi:bestrophin-3-like isoform X1 [Penaeus indicus]|uniref:bestrophin-3-like isoform X1 n=1 Tax=Penaeus indicus TaxID=29960 RepID=UPI00300C5D40